MGHDLAFLELADDSPETVAAVFAERGWGDGLPMVAPTEDRVATMLERSGAPSEEVLAVLPPREGIATTRLVAVNAVLAGCTPDLMPLLVQAVRMLGSDELNLASVNATTHPVAPLVIVHGEAALRLGFNSGAGAFGPGFASNATFGRAIRLLLLHTAGATPGRGDRSTQGQPSKYAFCIAENTAATPWDDFPTSIGIHSPSALSIFPVEGPHNVHDMESDAPEPLLDKFASVVTTFGSNHWAIHGLEILIAMCPEHAATVAARGWQRDDIAGYLFQRARLRSGSVKQAFSAREWPRWMRRLGDDELVPITDHPSKFRVVVTGGDGKHSSVLPAFATRSVTAPIQL